jgi:hypothetical protein
MNRQTHKYELPPPRWFNKDTGEFEDVKPMYFVDSSNPSLGFVAPTRVTREDDAFRQFMHDKETRRRVRVERERKEAEAARLAALNPPEEVVRIKRRREKATVDEFDEEQAQIAFREQTGRMVSKRGATAFMGPSAEKEELQRRELEERYEPLKPFATQDGDLEKLPPQINEEEIINAWKQSVAVSNTSISPSGAKKKRARKTEAERVRDLIKSKSGLKRGGAFSAMRGSYRPPNTIETSDAGGGGGWTDPFPTPEPKLLGATSTVEQDDRLKGWRTDQLRNSAWWDDRWKSRDAMREEKGRLAINPVTGKLEDIAAAKIQFPERGIKKRGGEDMGTGDLLMAEDIPFEYGMRVNREGKVETISFDEFMGMTA